MYHNVALFAILIFLFDFLSLLLYSFVFVFNLYSLLLQNFIFEFNPCSFLLYIFRFYSIFDHLHSVSINFYCTCFVFILYSVICI